MRRVSTGAPPLNTGGASLTGNSPPGRAKPQRIPGQCIKKRMAGVKRRRTRQAEPPRTGSKNTEAADRGEYQWFAELPGPPALAEPQYRKARASGRRVRANGVSGRVRAVAESHLPAAMELRDGQSTGCPGKNRERHGAGMLMRFPAHPSGQPRRRKRSGCNPCLTGPDGKGGTRYRMGK